MPKIDIAEINRRIALGRIKAVKHPYLDFTIYNYTQRTQFDSLWDEYTKICRGLILDSDYNIIARPFPKFFNLNENEETMIQNLPDEIPNMTEKLDGSLGILFPENERPAITTRGDFTSEYGAWATEWIRKHGFSMDDFKKDYTYCFEIVYPASKNVVDYGERSELVLLAVLSNSGKPELDHIKEAVELGLPFANVYPFSEIESALEWLEDFKGNEKEGLVARYSTGLRVKIKSEDYRRLHKILTGVSERDIWILLKDEKSLDPLLDLVPDEFYKWVKAKEQDLITAKDNLLRKASDIARDAGKFFSRKEQAGYVLKHAPEIQAIVFFLLDEKYEKARQAAWKMVKPSAVVFKDEKEDM